MSEVMLLEKFQFPGWLEFIPKPPKGLRWKDGISFVVNDVWADLRRGTFLPCGDELYTKNVFYPACWAESGLIYDPEFMGGNARELHRQRNYRMPTSIAVVHNYRSLTACDVIRGLGEALVIGRESAIFDAWKQLGLYCGLGEQILRPLQAAKQVSG